MFIVLSSSKVKPGDDPILKADGNSPIPTFSDCDVAMEFAKRKAEREPTRQHVVFEATAELSATVTINIMRFDTFRRLREEMNDGSR